MDYISSAGLRSLLVVAKKAQAVKAPWLCGLTPMVLNVMNISGFQQLLKICVTEQEAVGCRSAPGERSWTVGTVRAGLGRRRHC